MVAAKQGRSIFGDRHFWRNAVIATDWQRVLWQARGRHSKEHPDSLDTCGVCLMSVLLSPPEEVTIPWDPTKHPLREVWNESDVPETVTAGTSIVNEKLESSRCSREVPDGRCDLALFWWLTADEAQLVCTRGHVQATATREAFAGRSMRVPVQDWQDGRSNDMDSRRAHLGLAERMLTRLEFGDGSYKIRFDGETEKRDHFDPYKRERGQDWPLHAETMVGVRRLGFVRDQLFALGGMVPGSFVECGIWRGGVCILAAMWNELFDDGMHVYGFDSFEGLPKPGHYTQDDPDDPHHKVDVFRVSQEEVEQNFFKYGVHTRNFTLVKGWFRDTLPHWADAVDPIRMLRIDGDMFEGTMDPLVHLAPRVSPGGLIIVDDYGDVRECRRAVDEFRQSYYGLDAPDLNELDHTCVYWRQPWTK